MPTQPTLLRREFRVLVTKHADACVARLLEYDLVAQGHSVADAEKALERMIIDQLTVDIRYGQTPFEEWGKVPDQVERDYAMAEVVPNDDFFCEHRVTLPQAYILEARAAEIRLAKHAR